MYVILHGKLMLYHVGIWIYSLLGIFGQWATSDNGGSPIIVFACSPRGAMAGGASNLLEHLLALLYHWVLEVAGTRNRQSTMPYKEGIVVVVAHLGLKAIPRIVKLVGGGTEQVAHCIGNAIVCSISKIRRQGVGANY